MKKILFGITSLTIGGAERVLVDIANKLQNEFDITIFTIYANGDFEKDLNKNIKLKSLYNKQYKDLNKIEKILIPLKILFFKNYIYAKHIKDEYDAEISFLEGPATRLFSTKNKNTKKVAWIHNDISCVFGSGIKAKIKKVLDKRLYNKFQELVFVSKDNLEKFKEQYKTSTNTRVIYNYIDAKRVIEKSEEKIDFQFDKNSTNLVTVARLVEQKAIDRFIDVHYKLIQEGQKHNVYVIGDGPLKEQLQEKIQKLNLSKTFHLIGKKQNPYPYIKQADYFCLFSNFEGYGMVLDEAKILNKKILITNTAAREAVENYKGAMIFENTEAGILNGLKNVLNNNAKFDTEINKFNNEGILEEIKELLK